MIDVRNPVFWVVVALTGGGVVGLVPLLQAGFTGAPAGFILAVILWALFATFAWWLIRRLSRTRPRPRSATAAAFVWGAVAATGLGRWATGGTADILDALVADEAWASALAAGISEELLKILGVAALSLVAASRMRSALDFIYYGAFVGLGFMTTESLLYAAEGASTSESPTTIVIEYVVLRGVLAILWSHPTFSAIAALGLYHLLRSTAPAAVRWAAFWALLLAAMLLHAFFDSPLLEADAMVAFFAKGAIVLAVFLALYLPLRRKARDVAPPEAEDLVPASSVA